MEDEIFEKNIVNIHVVQFYKCNLLHSHFLIFFIIMTNFYIFLIKELLF